MSETRGRIARYVAENPGVHFNRVVRGLDLAPGQVQYHLRRLRRQGMVSRDRLYGRTHYYPPTVDEWERGALALLRRETARDVLLVLLEDGPAPPTALADRVGVARSTLEHHLDHLVEQGVVEKRYDDRRRVTVSLARPGATARLLAVVEPGVADRLLDRFTRLVDSLLETP